jgi:uncharacterized membrane protein YeaQ/YmgE (transglycosylase-associated protein family)
MTQPITVSFTLEQLIVWGVIGLIAGSVAAALVRGRRYSTLTSILVGLVGAIVGSVLFNLLRIEVSGELARNIPIRYIDFIVAFVGAVIVLLLLSLFYRMRRNP